MAFCSGFGLVVVFVLASAVAKKSFLSKECRLYLSVVIRINVCTLLLGILLTYRKNFLHVDTLLFIVAKDQK